jgi:hypothetical protein
MVLLEKLLVLGLEVLLEYHTPEQCVQSLERGFVMRRRCCTRGASTARFI